MIGPPNGWRVALAIASGILMAASFPPVGASVLAPVAVALLVIAAFRASVLWGLGLGLLQGLLCFGLLLRWLSVVGGDAWVLLTLLCAAWIALAGAGTALVTRLPAWPFWVACVWVLQEALRDRIPLGGFSWGRLAFAQTATSLTPWAAVAGAPAVTFVTALAGALLALVALLAWRRPPHWVRPSVLTAVGLVALALLGLLIPRPVAGQDLGGPASTTAAVIQGGVPVTGLGNNDQRRVVLDNHVRETVALAQRVAEGDAPQPQFVVWPENASDLDPFAVDEAAAAIDVAARAIEAPLIVGAVITPEGLPDNVANVGIVWDPQTGPGEYYVKTHPVPFGEYVPFRPLLTRIIGRFDLVPRDFIAGDVPGVLQAGPARIGDVICFEIAYDHVVREAVVAGGRAIVVQTNNATFAGLGQPEQQVAMSRLRAVEHGRTVLVAATSGISAIIDPAGRVLQVIPEGGTGALVAEIPLRDDLTLADRLGPWPEALLALAGAAAMLWALVGLGRRGVGRAATNGDGAQVTPEDA